MNPQAIVDREKSRMQIDTTKTYIRRSSRTIYNVQMPTLTYLGD